MILTYLGYIAVGAVLVVLLAGLWNMFRGGSSNTSQTLMRWRVILQFVAPLAAYLPTAAMAGVLFLVAWHFLLYMAAEFIEFSPAIAESRLQALQARIRPHFLFNSLNVLTSLIKLENSSSIIE